MKKKGIFVLVCLLSLLTLTVCFADEIIPTTQEPAQGPMRKLGRGLQNVTFGGLFQLGKDIEDTYKEEGVVAATTVGGIKGLVKGALRFVVGLYETLTFIIPGPENYKPIMNDPEFFLAPDKR